MSTASSKSGQSLYYCDPWPEDLDGEDLLPLVIGEKPTGFCFDTADIVALVHRELRSQVVDIRLATKGANNFVRFRCFINHMFNDSPFLPVGVSYDAEQRNDYTRSHLP